MKTSLKSDLVKVLDREALPTACGPSCALTTGTIDHGHPFLRHTGNPTIVTLIMTNPEGLWE